MLRTSNLTSKEKLVEGSYGELFLAKEDRNEEYVVLKFLLNEKMKKKERMILSKLKEIKQKAVLEIIGFSENEMAELKRFVLIMK